MSNLNESRVPMSDRLQILQESVRHLADVTSRLDPEQYTSPAFPSEWTIADTYSHLGSGAVIGKQNFENSINHRENDPAFNPSVWDEWNAKEPSVQVSDCLVYDRSYLSALEDASPEQRESFSFNLGPYTFDFEGLVGLRLSEHALHTWDIEVAIDPHATLSSEVANAILDSVNFIVSMTGKSTGQKKSVTIRTTAPVRNFTIELDASSVRLVESINEGTVDLELPTDALVRLIYGRLDAKHTPSSLTGEVVDELRQVFPGF